MGWSFRKRINLGAGLRVNVSNRGVGASAGVKGARVGVNSAGRRYSSLSVPGTGLRYTSGGGGRRGAATDDVDYLDDLDGDAAELLDDEHGPAPRRPVGFLRRALGLLLTIAGLLVVGVAATIVVSAGVVNVRGVGTIAAGGGVVLLGRIVRGK